MLALVELNFDDLVGKDRAYGGCVHAVAEASTFWLPFGVNEVNVI